MVCHRKCLGKMIRAFLAMIAVSVPVIISCAPSEIFAGPFFNLLGFEAPVPPPGPTFLVVVQNRLSPADPSDLTLLPPAPMTFDLNAVKGRNRGGGSTGTTGTTGASGIAGGELTTISETINGGEQVIYVFSCDVKQVSIDNVVVSQPNPDGTFSTIDVTSGDNAVVTQGQRNGEFRCGDVVSFQVIRRLASEVSGTGSTGTVGVGGTGSVAVAYTVATEIARR